MGLGKTLSVLALIASFLVAIDICVRADGSAPPRSTLIVTPKSSTTTTPTQQANALIQLAIHTWQNQINKYYNISIHSFTLSDRLTGIFIPVACRSTFIMATIAGTCLKIWTNSILFSQLMKL